jgi:signal transduction histidine kinase
MTAALGAIPAVGAVIQVLKTYERERTERERLEQLQRATAAQVEAIVRASEATGLGILVAAPLQGGGDRIVSSNAQAANLIGLAQDAILGRELVEIFVAEDREPFEKLKAKVMGNPRLAASGSFHLASNNPRTGAIPVDLGLTQETTPTGIMFGVTLVDARRRRTALAAAQEARSDADFYLDLVTHDLSNFNQGALGYLELLELDRDAPADRRARFEANALRQIKNSARLIENVKLLSIIRESRDPIGPTDALFALHDAIDHVVSVTTEKEVEVRLVPTTPAHNVRADAWLRDLFVHLLDNAVKFTPGKRVEVAVSVAENSDQRSLVFRIADHGRGITPDERTIILDRLASRKQDYSAYRSGIGLFIVKTIADRYGAKLAIEDRVPGEPDQGCVFSLEIPTPQAHVKDGR